MPPEQPLPVKCNRIYQIMWANNGDSISRQYAGTAALKVSTCSQHLWVIMWDTGYSLKPTWFLRGKYMGFRWQVQLTPFWNVWVRQGSHIQIPQMPGNVTHQIKGRDGLCGPEEEHMLSQEGAVLLLPNGDGGPVLLDLTVFKGVWKVGILSIAVKTLYRQNKTCLYWWDLGPWYNLPPLNLNPNPASYQLCDYGQVT